MSTFLALFLILAAIPLGFVLLSYAFAWYETANRSPALLTGRFAPSSLGFACRLIALEWLCLLATVLLHPLGWLPERTPPSEEPESCPVLFLHGLFHNRSCWTWMKHTLKKRGMSHLYTLNLPPWQDMETLTARIAQRVDHILQSSGAEKLHLVGHSMGGILARNFVQLHEGAGKVDGCVLLAAPNEGSKLVPFAVSPLAKNIMPRSDFLQRLGHASIPRRTRFLSIASRHDNIVLPSENARWDQVPNLELEGMGHATLLYHPRAIEAIFNHLKGIGTCTPSTSKAGSRPK